MAAAVAIRPFDGLLGLFDHFIVARRFMTVSVKFQGHAPRQFSMFLGHNDARHRRPARRNIADGLLHRVVGHSRGDPQILEQVAEYAPAADWRRCK